jgi:hypothetical protein
MDGKDWNSVLDCENRIGKGFQSFRNGAGLCPIRGYEDKWVLFRVFEIHERIVGLRPRMSWLLVGIINTGTACRQQSWSGAISVSGQSLGFDTFHIT